MSGAPHQLRLRRVIDETADARSFELEVPPELAGVYRYQSGQFLAFDVLVGGRVLRRCYSLSSAPHVDPHPVITVKRVADGPVSSWFNAVPRPGDMLQVAPPAGRFVLGTEPTPLCLYAAGSGITPIISLMKTALRTWSTPIRLFYANRDAKSVIFRTALDRMLAEHPARLSIRHHLDVRDGLTSEAELTAFVGDAIGPRHYICGPAPFMGLVDSVLLKSGAPRSDIYVERFAVSDEAPFGKNLAETTADITITLDGQTCAVRSRESETVLEAARRAGLQPPSSCESGICAACLAKVTGGRAIMRQNEVLNAEEVAEGLALTCQAVPASSVLKVEY
jgi:3-ketosteroid 9alpha-monooxygenase subunit B